MQDESNSDDDDYPSTDEGNIFRNPSEDNILDSFINYFKYNDISFNEIDSVSYIYVFNSYVSFILLGLLILLISSSRIILINKDQNIFK